MKIAIIGGGASGLGVLRALTSTTHFFDICVYEKAEKVGGLWNYGPTGPVYDHLRTNLPKEIMCYPDLPFNSTVKESFVGHSDVLDYLNDYAKVHNLLPYIKFRHTVKWIDPVNSDDSLTSWKVTVIDECQNKETTDVFDSVLLCNGNYNIPIVPEIPGLAEFDGDVLHSVSYRSSEKFRDKIVIVIGAASSGQDIAHEAAKFADKVILSHSGKLSINENILQQAPRIKYIDSDRKTVVFQDGSTCQPHVIILATGYSRNFQFCSSRCQLSTDNCLYYPLYKHLIHAKFHRFFVIAVCNRIIPFPFAYYQGCLIKSVLEGDCILPSSDEMISEIEKEKHNVLDVEGRPPHKFHVLDMMQFPYLREIAEMANRDHPIKVNELIYKHAFTIRHADFSTFRKTKYKIINDEEFIVE